MRNGVASICGSQQENHFASSRYVEMPCRLPWGSTTASVSGPGTAPPPKLSSALLCFVCVSHRVLAHIAQSQANANLTAKTIRDLLDTYDDTLCFHSHSAAHSSTVPINLIAPTLAWVCLICIPTTPACSAELPFCSCVGTLGFPVPPFPAEPCSSLALPRLETRCARTTVCLYLHGTLNSPPATPSTN